MEPDCGDGGFDDDLSEIADEKIDWVKKEEISDHGAVVVYGIEDGGHVHQQLGEHRPKVLNIPEENEEGGEDKAHPNVKQHQAADGVDQQDELPGEGDVIQDAEHKEHTECQAEVDEGLDVFGEQEKILGDIHLGEDAGIAHEGLHSLAGGFAEAGKNKVSAKQISCIMWCASTKKLGKHHSHN